MKIIVIGAGSWGLTLAHIFSFNNEVTVWTLNQHIASELTQKRSDPRLPCLKINQSIAFHPMYSTEFDNTALFIMVAPSNVVEEICLELKNHIDQPNILCASKGFDHRKFCTMSQLIQSIFPKSNVAVLTGPTIAKEVAAGKPTKAILASNKVWFLTEIAKALENDYVKFELDTDIVGHELCACLKGIIAIGTGIADGLGLGKNMQGIIMTYGLKEFVEIAEFLGASSKTIYGLAGMSDLITTCISTDSRNRKLGFLLGQNLKLEDALEEVGMVVEGLNMQKTIYKLERVNIDIPIISAINKIIFNPPDNIYDFFLSTLLNTKKK
ncbi:NAD(P)H-dependent glycerol-3-phosphate dehydrogenase [bacterium]|nr:NAD(P)H-dependent glycerol-3-phosphate dehydrogenase [bacterium]MCP5462727.1 NAD(P)H-dependent glycerol-3-phosphate dehydrogenase [bacterium]